jgi:HEAT repeat protein
MHAIDALRSATSPEAVEALIDALRDQDSDVREKADANLVQLTGHSVTKPNQPAPSALQLENLWRAWWHKHASDTTLAQPPEILCRMS